MERQRIDPRIVWLGPKVRQALPAIGSYLGCVVAAALIAAPVVLERAVEGVRFSDHLGTLPVEVSLCHDGRSTLDTGLFGKVFWAETGSHGFGAYARATAPPEAGGTLASYVDPAFIEANVTLIDNPNLVVDAYSAKFAQELRSHFLRDELIASILGGAVLLAILPPRRLRGAPVAREVMVASVLVVGAVAVSTGVSLRLFDGWSCSQQIAGDFAMPGVDRLSFASRETQEVAQQVRPFVEKSIDRTREEAQRYEAAASETFGPALERRAAGLTPRDGETIVLAEGDPQGSLVGTRVRTMLYTDLVEALGADAISLRTISGDVTSNGTVAESTYVSNESKVSGGIPTVAVGGDHDSETTWQQMEDEGMSVPDMETVEVAGIRVSGANDREHKTLFGGIVTNESGVTEQELGTQLREAGDDQPRITLLHQPDAAAGYLGLDSLDPVHELNGSLTVPHDDGIPDLPPGSLSIGHLHEAAGPWVLWNTDGDQVTWTVVDQLGTAGGVENHPTFNRFSTPGSPPLRPLSVRLQYLNVESGLQTGYATITCDLAGTCSITRRVDVGIPGDVQSLAPGRG